MPGAVKALINWDRRERVPRWRQAGSQGGGKLPLHGKFFENIDANLRNTVHFGVKYAF